MISCPKCAKDTYDAERRFCANRFCNYRDITPIKDKCPKCGQDTFSVASGLCNNSHCRYHERNTYGKKEERMIAEPNWDLLLLEQEMLNEGLPQNRTAPPPNRKLMASSGKVPKPGWIYSCQYANWHNDPHPMLFVLAANDQDVWGLNIYYLKRRHLQKLQELIQAIKNNVQAEKNFHNPKEFYHRFLKHKYKELIDIGFRRYKTRWFMGVPMDGGVYQYLERKTPPICSSNYVKTKLQKMGIGHTQYNQILSYRDKLENLKVKVTGLAYRHKA